MNEQSVRFHSINAAIAKLSQTQEKMTIDDIKRETGIIDPGEILNDMMRRGLIYYVNSTEFKKTPSR